MAKHAELATFQRFDFLNILNILYLQAELVHLELDLKESMREDLESENNMTSERRDDRESLNEAENVNLEFGEIEDTSTDEGVNERTPTSEAGRRSTSETSSLVNERVESARDWWYLSRMDNSRTWEIMLKARGKLKEYS